MTAFETQPYIVHHGVKGQKWGVRRKRDKSSFNTNHANVRTDGSGRLMSVNGKWTSTKDNAHKSQGITRHQNNKANRAAVREGNAYRKAYGSRATYKDQLSVMGNKYNSEVKKYQAANRFVSKENNKRRLVADLANSSITLSGVSYLTKRGVR